MCAVIEGQKPTPAPKLSPEEEQAYMRKKIATPIHLLAVTDINRACREMLSPLEGDMGGDMTQLPESVAPACCDMLCAVVQRYCGGRVFIPSMLGAVYAQAYTRNEYQNATDDLACARSVYHVVLVRLTRPPVFSSWWRPWSCHQGGDKSLIHGWSMHPRASSASLMAN